MYKKLQDMDIKEKRVLVRCDFNVPIEDGKILDPNKIEASLKTITYLMGQKCRIILMSHLGKVKSNEDKIKNTLEPVAEYLRTRLGCKIIFSKQPRNLYLGDKINEMNPGEILLLENTRFEDFPNKLESENDLQLASYWAGLADVFVMDAFGSAHRKHASTYGVAKLLPNCIGFLMQKELENLEKLVVNPKRPFTIVVGGAKVDDKIELINKLLPNCDHLLLTGGIANSCLKVLGFNIGNSLASKDPIILEELKRLLLANESKIMLPLDAMVGRIYDKGYLAYHKIDEILVDDIISDIGLKTLQKYKTAIDASETIFVNGTAGIYEDEKFSNGTRELLNIIGDSKATTIVGGGDSVSAVNKFKVANKFDFISTGGGATLEYILKGTLSALEAINKE